MFVEIHQKLFEDAVHHPLIVQQVSEVPFANNAFVWQQRLIYQMADIDSELIVRVVAMQTHRLEQAIPKMYLLHLWVKSQDSPIRRHLRWRLAVRRPLASRRLRSTTPQTIL